MATRKALMKTPDAEVEQARTSFMTAVANTITDALPTPGGDSGTWGPKLNTFLTDLGALVFSKISSVNGRTPDGNGDLDLDSVYASQALLGTLAPLASPAFTGTPTLNGSPLTGGGGGLTVVDNADGTLTITAGGSSTVVDNNDGTLVFS